MPVLILNMDLFVVWPVITDRINIRFILIRNVLLRKKQYESLNDIEFCTQTVKNILYGKIRNSKCVLLRSARNKDSDEKRNALLNSVEKLSSIAKALLSKPNHCRNLFKRSLTAAALSTMSKENTKNEDHFTAGRRHWRRDC